MPGIILHRQIARVLIEEIPALKVLESDPQLLHEYYQGAIAPDMGVFPGTPAIISNLFHYHKTAELARNLLKAAPSEGGRVFALGWIGHLLEDAIMHPLVNRGAGELLYGDYRREI